MGLFDFLAHRRRTRQVKRFERYIQQAKGRHRYDPSVRLKSHGVVPISCNGQGAILAYCPQSKKLCYFSPDQVDPALVRVAETMLGIFLDNPANAPTTSYIVTMRDLVADEGPVDNRHWSHYMQALDCLMPIDVVLRVRQEVATLGETQHLSYAYCRIFHLPMGIVKKRYKDAALGVHHQTSFTNALTLLKDKLSNDPRIERPDHSHSPTQRRKYRDRPQ